MKTWLGEYDWHGGWGAYEVRRCVIIAETESVALGLALENYADTTAPYWAFTEIQTDKNEVIHVHSGS